METLIISHGLCAYLSLALLLIRGVLSVKMVDWRRFKLLKILPHVVDTALLVTGIALVYILLANGYAEPRDLSWLVQKLILIVLYIVFAHKAFKKNAPFSLKYFLLSVVSFMFVIIAAIIQ